MNAKTLVLKGIAAGMLIGLPKMIYAADVVVPPAPCHPNPNAATDGDTVVNRGDITNLPDPLKDRLGALAKRPHSILPVQAYAEAGKKNDPSIPDPSQLFQYYLLNEKGFEPNVFTTQIPGVNETAMLTVTGVNCGLTPLSPGQGPVKNQFPTIGAVRLVVEPKKVPELLPTDPNNPRTFIDVFTDISGLFVINNESGWYEGWMIHDLQVADIAEPRSDGHAQFGKITMEDANILAMMGAQNGQPGNNGKPGNVFTIDGQAPHFPNKSDHFPDRQTNVVPIQLSMGAYNAYQQGDAHSYWEFNYNTNWVHPLYELPFTGGFPDQLGQAPHTFEDGEIGKLQSIVPGSGPNGIQNEPQDLGDNPNLPRDTDKFDADVDAQREFRQRFIPSGLAREIFLDVFQRLASFEPDVKDLNTRLFDAYAAEVARVETTVEGGVVDGVISFPEGDIDTASDGFEDNSRLFLPAPTFKRFAVTREINDGLLAPRFAPSQRAWILRGSLVTVDPVRPASSGRDSDDR